jgi:hypothetical protein
MNADQEDFIANRHGLDVILKARQRGFTTVIQLDMLDDCLFTSNLSAGVIAHNLKDAKAFFSDKIKFAYDNLPEAVPQGARGRAGQRRQPEVQQRLIHPGRHVAAVRHAPAAARLRVRQALRQVPRPRRGGADGRVQHRARRASRSPSRAPRRAGPADYYDLVKRARDAGRRKARR